MDIVPFVTESLGDSSYLLVSGQEALVVDPQRDIRPYLAAAENRGARILRVLETHVHNDYISGGPAFLALGATVTAPETAKLEFPHQTLGDGDVLPLGSLHLRAVATPGHTYEHTAYLVAKDEAPLAAFSGGSLLVGAAGRSDLLGAEHTDELTRLQFQSSRRLAEMLTPESRILPTHGAGSFCSSTGTATDRTSLLRLELGRNPALTSGDYETFARLQLGSPSPTPDYYRFMAPINRAGDRRTPAPPAPTRLNPEALVEVVSSGVPALDIRARSEYAAAHVPGTVSVEESQSFLGYVSWLYPFDTELALVSYDTHQAERVASDLHRIGYERVRGYLPFHQWLEEGHDGEALASVELPAAADILRHKEAEVLDVRFEREHGQLPLEGARQAPIDRIQEWAPTIGDGPILVVCASGQRATTAASYLAVRGVDAVPLIRGGAEELRAWP